VLRPGHVSTLVISELLTVLEESLRTSAFIENVILELQAIHCGFIHRCEMLQPVIPLIHSYDLPIQNLFQKFGWNSDLSMGSRKTQMHSHTRSFFADKNTLLQSILFSCALPVEPFYVNG
jgi:hypothetical protein